MLSINHQRGGGEGDQKCGWGALRRSPSEAWCGRLTNTSIPLALIMSRKLFSDPQLAIHGKIMAKNGHLLMEFWPTVDIFTDCGHIHVLDRGWSKNGPFWTKHRRAGESASEWDLSKILHCQIFRLKILHLEFHWISTALVIKTQKMCVFGEIYTTGKKICTAGGSDSSDKSHFWVE